MDRLAHILNRKGIDMAKKLLDKDRVYVPPFKREYIDQIVNIICDHFGADQQAVTKRSYRGAKEVIAKYVSIYFLLSQHSIHTLPAQAGDLDYSGASNSPFLLEKL